MVLVVAGKGGVGKTSISAMLVRLLVDQVRRLLVIDADPVVSLAYALGEQPQTTIGALREQLIEDPRRAQEVRNAPLKSTLRELLTPSTGYDLLTMGRGEGKGCFCGINELLRYGVETLCSEYDLTLIDCEAGIEQVNRRAVHRIDRLLVIADTCRRSLEAAAQVRDLAAKYNEGSPLPAWLLVNRARGGEDMARARAAASVLGLKLKGCVPEDPNVREYNARGEALGGLPPASPAIVALSDVLASLSREL
jgi:CO dehydrogenase maturation factor